MYVGRLFVEEVTAEGVWRIQIVSLERRSRTPAAHPSDCQQEAEVERWCCGSASPGARPSTDAGRALTDHVMLP